MNQIWNFFKRNMRVMKKMKSSLKKEILLWVILVRARMYQVKLYSEVI